MACAHRSRRHRRHRLAQPPGTASHPLLSDHLHHHPLRPLLSSTDSPTARTLPFQINFEDGWMDGTEDGLASSSKSWMASPPKNHHQQQQSLVRTAEDFVSICKPFY
ncbi:hypothetical protein TYRP_006962 [Tyrophagus putrescentiae]|nr:hypothetical protein TYRP_006962 [Tyrophagus putrescentiae]